MNLQQLNFVIKEDKIYMICPYSGKECNDSACGRVTTKICIKPSPIEPEENKTMKECITEVRIMIAKIHDDIEGRYDLDSYDKSIIQSMLCGIISDKDKPVDNKSMLPVALEQVVKLMSENKDLKTKVSELESQLLFYAVTALPAKDAELELMQSDLVKAKELLNDFIDEFDERIIGNWKLREKVKSFLSDEKP